MLSSRKALQTRVLTQQLCIQLPVDTDMSVSEVFLSYQCGRSRNSQGLQTNTGRRLIFLRLHSFTASLSTACVWRNRTCQHPVQVDCPRRIPGRAVRHLVLRFFPKCLCVETVLPEDVGYALGSSNCSVSSMMCFCSSQSPRELSHGPEL